MTAEQDGEGHEEDDDEEGEAGPSHEDEDMADDDYVHDTSAHCFEGHQESVYAVAWSPVSATVVATGGGDDKQVDIHDPLSCTKAALFIFKNFQIRQGM